MIKSAIYYAVKINTFIICYFYSFSPLKRLIIVNSFFALSISSISEILRKSIDRNPVHNNIIKYDSVYLFYGFYNSSHNSYNRGIFSMMSLKSIFIVSLISSSLSDSSLFSLSM